MSCSGTLGGSFRRSVCDVRGGVNRFKWNDRRRTRRWAGALVVAVCTSVCASASAQNFSPAPTVSAQLDCGYQSPEMVQAAIRAAVEAGEIADPLAQPLPQVAGRTVFGGHLRGGGVPTVTTADITPFEDSASLLLTNFSDGELLGLMAQATNDVIAAEGDNFDFVGFFVNFIPDHQIGAAFYAGLENDVSGIGLGIGNDRPAAGVVGDNVQGWVMMWRPSSWGPDDTTMLVMGQEFEHRWGLFLDPLLDGRSLQGDNAGCGRSSHWSWKVDGQGSGMEIREWIGSSPAVLGGSCSGGFPFICNNTDIGDSPSGLGAVFSYTDLYLMGYVSPAEMDAGNSELRYMDNSDCNSDYNGTISTFTSADIVASNGARTPNAASAQHDFRTAWVMIHLPGAPPTAGEQANVVNILNRWSEDWSWSTLALGTMDNTLQAPVPCPGHDGDTNGDTLTDGQDIPSFVDGIVSGSAAPAVVCSGDFDNSGSLGLGDVPGMVSALLGP